MLWSEIAIEVAQKIAGETTRVCDIPRPRDGRVALMFYHRPELPDAASNPLFIGGGENEESAYRALVAAMCRRDRTHPTTIEAAEILNVSEGRVRALVQHGRLVPLRKGSSRTPAGFTPQSLYGVIKTRRRWPGHELGIRVWTRSENSSESLLTKATG